MNSFCGIKVVFEQIIARVKTENANQEVKYIAYLPLAHIFEFLVQHIMFISGVEIGYSSPNTLIETGTAIRKGDKGDMNALNPSIMIAVPLILDRIKKGINNKMRNKGMLASRFFDFLIEYKAFWTNKGIFKQEFKDISYLNENDLSN